MYVPRLRLIGAGGATFRGVRRRGVALLLALIAATVAAVLASAYLSEQGGSLGIARNIQDRARARCVTAAGLDLTMAYIKATATWRTARTHGTWVSSQSLCGGAVSVRVEDGIDANGDGVISTPTEGDGNLANDAGQSFTITVSGTVERREPAGGRVFWSACDILRAEVRPAGGDLNSFWALDEGAGNKVSGGIEQTGTLINMDPATSWVPGKFGQALRFTGNNGYVTMPDTSAVEITTAGTVSAWININSFKNAFAGIVHKGTRADFKDEAYTLQFWTNNRFYWGVTTPNGAQPNVISPSAPPTGTWVHVLGTWDSTAMKLYVDGVMVASRAGVEAIRSPGAFNIGAQLDAPPYYSFDGLIDDVRIYNRALTAGEVAAIAGGAPPTTFFTTYLVDLQP